MKQADAKKAIIELWLQRPNGERRQRDLMLFYPQLEQEHHDLLNFRCVGDKWQTFKLFLQDHLED